MKTILLKLFVSISVFTGAALGITGCNINVYTPENQSVYLNLVSDYTEIVPESEWGCKWFSESVSEMD